MVMKDKSVAIAILNGKYYSFVFKENDWYSDEGEVPPYSAIKSEVETFTPLELCDLVS